MFCPCRRTFPRCARRDCQPCTRCCVVTGESTECTSPLNFASTRYRIRFLERDPADRQNVSTPSSPLLRTGAGSSPNKASAASYFTNLSKTSSKYLGSPLYPSGGSSLPSSSRLNGPPSDPHQEGPPESRPATGRPEPLDPAVRVAPNPKFSYVAVGLDRCVSKDSLRHSILTGQRGSASHLSPDISPTLTTLPHARLEGSCRVDLLARQSDLHGVDV